MFEDLLSGPIYFAMNFNQKVIPNWCVMNWKCFGFIWGWAKGL